MSDIAPRPWSCSWSVRLTSNGIGHVYLVDATGRKIAALWGKEAEKIAHAEKIIELINGAKS